MGTRSRIAVMHGDKVKSVYCHWDGYVANNGRILQEHYDSAKANQLVALGDLSSLRPEIGEKHAFSAVNTEIDSKTYERLYGNMTTFYGRDRGESNVEFQVAHSFAEFLEQVHLCGGEYYYIMKDGVWYCGDIYESYPTPLTNKLTPLLDAIAALEKEEA